MSFLLSSPCLLIRNDFQSVDFPRKVEMLIKERIDIQELLYWLYSQFHFNFEYVFQ